MTFRFLSLIFLLLPVLAAAEQARVAVAANFAGPARELAEAFAADHPYRIELVAGSSARFFAQVRSGAPFDAFLSADYEKAALLVDQGFAVAESLQVYAVGRLVLWTAASGKTISAESLSTDGQQRLALANPSLAPYGSAASEVIDNLGLSEQLAGRLVMGENISQAYQFVATGNAPLGFVALSQVGNESSIERGSGWLVPAELHAPIRQYAVLLNTDSIAAGAFLEFLQGPQAKRIISGFGYTLEPAKP